MDTSVSPCKDFYDFADGGWLKSHFIPAAYPAWGIASELRDHNEDILHSILEDAARDKKAQAGSNWRKIGDFYASCMNEPAIEAAGVKPLNEEFARIAAIHDLAGLQAEIARLQMNGARAVFNFGSEQDPKNSTQVIAGAGQGGLGLPDRDYYLRDDAKSKQLRAAYLAHVANMFQLLGDDAATAAAESHTVMDMETQLAKSSMPRADLRDPDKTYHKLTLAELAALTPHFDWKVYFTETGAPAVDSMDIGQPDFFKQVDASLTSLPLASWKVYLRWHLIHSAAPALSSKFVEENFNFYGRTLRGTTEILPRWRRCVESTDANLGEALGQYYVQRAFPPEAKASATAMVKNLVAALRDDISTLDWMSPATRQQAIIKLEAINLKIGYPDKWRDYSPLHITDGSYVENLQRGRDFAFSYDVAKIGRPVNRTDWDMTPPTVNAYYSPTMNEIVFPAGILQPPFFDPHRDDAMNYGAIGSVIGHEMTHGFDDQGAKFDAHGNLKNWWTPEDLKNFQQRGDCIAQQFAAFEFEPGLHENGKLVEGESIADLGGLTISYAAFRKSLQGKPEPPKIDGFTADQRFFISFAQEWTYKLRPEYARLLIHADEHPLPQYRATAPLTNMPAFQKAFACRADSPMARPEAKRCRIW